MRRLDRFPARLEALLVTGNRTEAKREALAALEVAPTYERAQDILLKLVDGPR